MRRFPRLWPLSPAYLPVHPLVVSAALLGLGAVAVRAAVRAAAREA